MPKERTIINSGYYYIKPAANHILTIGKGIIKDAYTAILELVKNSYDADAENVHIKIKCTPNLVQISIADDGHGMSFQVVTEKWMVPSTAEKIRQKKSVLKKRPLQGRKGIGRYAASILGNELTLKTTERDSLVTTELLIDWRDFNSDKKYLEDIDILIESYKNETATSGTELYILGDKIWTDKELSDLILSLKRLISPFDEIENDFNIFLDITKEDSDKYASFSEKISPLPILEYYHYRVSGSIKLLYNSKQDRKVLTAKLTLENNQLTNFLPVKIEKEIILDEGEAYCGDVKIDIRAFDLDEDLVIKDNKIGVDEAKQLLKELPGIAVIREGFRVRPYGDKKVDWLDLNTRRYNNPTLRLSVNQVAGFVSVLQEDESHLEEKATREGFKEDEHYEGLKRYILDALFYLEDLRYKFRRLHNKGRKTHKTITEQIADISNFDSLTDRVQQVLTKGHVSDSISMELKGIIDEEAKVKEEQLSQIKKTIAQYEGQVTLGRIMSVVLHEGRKPLNALRQHPKFIAEWTKEFLFLLSRHFLFEDKELTLLREKILDRLNDNKMQAEIFVGIFKKLEPLANSKRPSPREFEINKTISEAFKLFEFELSENNISFGISGHTGVFFKGWEVDFFIVFANLIENSIYWLSQSSDKKIDVIIIQEEEKITIDYSDTGTGIDEENIETQNIFDPGYSTKKVGDVAGTGLGLSIVGEALARNGATIRAVSNDQGANFIIEILKK